MYLKRIEMVGFKSFAEKTRLEFEPGLMAIVGPNGCGKSNISDAIRWVLGEQSAKALRGAKMEDCIFAGTDSQKPLGMAEVSLTLADCEAALGTEYHEVTVTRRVHRSGEGQYLINRSPCRLKDIQRLFMDTGVGTQSYSLMEQGRIDRILSSRPEDRRSVFEEASGITKFKADRKEALRKLDQTEANLLRLADIIREVRRQIISLQRQAGKARRYQALRDELRSHELFFTRDRLETMDQALQEIEARRAGLKEREEAASEQVEGWEQRVSAAREELAAHARNLESAQEAIREARYAWERTRESIDRNRQREADLKGQVDQDTRDIEQATERLAAQQNLCAELEQSLARAESARDEATRVLTELTARLKASEDDVEACGADLHRLRTEALDLETRASARQKEWSDLDARERSSRLRRERLEAEKTGLRRALANQQERGADVAERMRACGEVAEQSRTRHEANLSARAERIRLMREIEDALRPIGEQAAAARSRLEWVRRQEAEAEGFPGGARLLLDESAGDGFDRSRIWGTLAGQLEIDPDYRVAVEAVLRPWLDAVVVGDAGAAHAALTHIQHAASGSARVLAAETPDTLSEPSARFGEPLRARVRAPAALSALCDRLLCGVFVVDALPDAPQPIPPGVLAVTRSGLVASAGGMFSCWMPDSESATPIARAALLQTWSDELERLDAERSRLETRRDQLRGEEAAESKALAESASALDEAQQALSRAEGQRDVVERETEEAAQRLETVELEIGSMHDEGASSETRRRELQADLDRIRSRQDEVRAASAQYTERLRAAEKERGARLGAVTDQRVEEAEQRREADSLSIRLTEQRARIAELQETIRTRSERVRTHHERMEDARRTAEEAQARLEPMREEIARLEQRAQDVAVRHEQMQTAVTQAEEKLRAQRDALAEFQQSGSRLDIDLAQRRTRRQDLMERVTQDYRIAEDVLFQSPEPEWDGGTRPEREALETRVAELRAKLEAMGAVNLVAIEEHEELEKRFTFLEEQQRDLVASKQHLMDLIRRINQTTTALFSETFAQVNENFGAMFKRMFGGGSAKLLLIDEADVLESGIEIIARPPGKKLQSVSLLSGGERTLTAVALLFSLYRVKPSPFCLLDELDAALDDANIERFVDTVKDFLRQSQFIVITHNRRTIAAADALYGVTMERQGVSRIVSVRFNRDGRPEAAEAEETAEEAEAKEAAL